MRPVEALDDAVRSLEAAALVCLATPKKKPVHQLRTWTRRIEALLELIALTPHASAARKQRDKAMRLLKKLRRAAGAVRDLDVERDLIAEEAARAKGTSRDARATRKKARDLRSDLKEQREDEAEALQSLLKEERKKLPLALKDLSDALAPLEKTRLAEGKLIDLVRDWYVRPNARRELASKDETEALHAIRKRAKLARYMAEAAPHSEGRPAARAQRLAARFEALQHAGGTWHDWLQLRDVAAKELGKSSRLSRHFAARADGALRVYKRQLSQPIFR